jgi:hypothetical protein
MPDALEVAMPLSLLALILATVTHISAENVHWTERYFGVGSAEERNLACNEARGHADGNSTNACVDKRGMRAVAEYTECICVALAEGDHVCNVNLKVVCDGPFPSADQNSSIRSGGKPKGRAGRTATGRGPRVRSVRPGLEDSKKSLEGRWTAEQR